MKIPKLPRLSSLAPQPKPRKPPTKLAAHARRLTPSAYEDYDEEPSTKLSSAFVVVLVLHLVAVGGIWAFHSIKAKRRDADGTAAVGGPAKLAPQTATAVVAGPRPPSTPAPAPVSNAAAQTQPKLASPQGTPEKTQAAGVSTTAQAPGGAASKTAVGAPGVAAPNAVKPPAASVVAPVPATSPEQAPKIYTVQKGDNPVAIAKKLGVGYEELLKVNGVDDPKKLQIGQVLKVPVKKSAEPAAH